MKIIKQGNLERNIRRISCCKCGCVFEYNPREETVNKCPNCKASKSYLREVTKDFIPAEDTEIETPSSVYPEKYYDYSNGANISTEQIKKTIDELLNAYKRDGGGYVYSACGNTLVCIMQTNKEDIDSYEVIVTKNYKALDSMELDSKD